MIKKKKTCVKCNNEAYIWSKSMCKSCFMQNTIQKPIKKSYLSKKPTEKQIQKNIEKKDWLEELHQWEFALWDKQKDINNQCFCFESGEVMHESLYKYNLCIYSHILPKGIAKYKKYAMKEWNVKIVKPQYHELFENKSEKAAKQLQLEKELKEIYG